MNFTGRRHHTDMHGICVGDFVYEVDGCEETNNTPPSERCVYGVVGVFGNYKSDYIQIIEDKHLNKLSPLFFCWRLQSV